MSCLSFRLAAGAAAIAASVAGPAGSAIARDRIVLTIEGVGVGAAPIELSIAEIEAMGTDRIATSTPWHHGIVTFEGVSLQTLMAHLGAEGSMLSVDALNGYETTIPFSDLAEYHPILASRMNGALMSVAEKGPLFVIYDFDGVPMLHNELFYSRSAWQVRRIVVE